MSENNWYVITGGPSAGKSKTLDHLAYLGYQVMPEAARILIDLELSRGNTVASLRSDEKRFQDLVLEMKLEVEARLPKDKLTFLERGIPDSVVYYELIGADPTPAQVSSSYKGIFLLDQVQFEKDYARTETPEQAREINLALGRVYDGLGYGVFQIPVKPLDERCRMIQLFIEGNKPQEQ